MHYVIFAINLSANQGHVENSIQKIAVLIGPITINRHYFLWYSHKERWKRSQTGDQWLTEVFASVPSLFPFRLIIPSTCLFSCLF